MIIPQRSGAQAEEGDQDQRAESDDLSYSAGVLKPLADREAEHGYGDEKRYERNRDREDEPFVAAQPIEADGVGDISGYRHSLRRHEYDDVQPQIPADQEADEIVEAELGPLIEAAFERHGAVQMDHDGGERSVEKEQSQQPENDLRGAQLSGRSYPMRSDDIQNLGENQISKAQFFLEFGAVG